MGEQFTPIGYKAVGTPSWGEWWGGGNRDEEKNYICSQEHN